MYRLENWYFEKNKDVYRVWGNVYDHAHFMDGQWIHTSAIREVQLQSDALVIQTSHAAYQAAFTAHQKVDYRILKKALHDYVWPEDEGLYQKILSAGSPAEILPTPDSCGTCTVLVFGEGLQEVLLKYRRKEKVVTSYDIHKNMFQDVIEISDPNLDYCYRFFSYQKNGYEFEPWGSKYAPVFLQNTGKNEINVSTVYGDFLIPAGMTCILTADNIHNRVFLKERKTSFNETTVLSHESLKLKKD